MSARPAIPSVPHSGGREQSRFDSAVKERLELIAGERGKRVKPLPADADLAAVVAKINELLGVLQ